MKLSEFKNILDGEAEYEKYVSNLLTREEKREELLKWKEQNDNKQ